MGYGWIALDTAVSVFLINGGPVALGMPVRLGGHVSAAVWILLASLRLSTPNAWIGSVLALSLGGHSLIAPFYRRPLLLYGAGFLMIVWLVGIAIGLIWSSGA